MRMMDFIFIYIVYKMRARWHKKKWWLLIINLICDRERKKKVSLVVRSFVRLLLFFWCAAWKYEIFVSPPTPSIVQFSCMCDTAWFLCAWSSPHKPARMAESERGRRPVPNMNVKSVRKKMCKYKIVCEYEMSKRQSCIFREWIWCDCGDDNL